MAERLTEDQLSELESFFGSTLAKAEELADGLDPTRSYGQARLPEGAATFVRDLDLIANRAGLGLSMVKVIRSGPVVR